MTIETILRQKGTYVATIEPEASIRRAADWLRIKNIGALVVTNGNAVRGLISEREIVHAFSRYGETAASMPVKEIMRQGVTTVSPEESRLREPHAGGEVHNALLNVILYERHVGGRLRCANPPTSGGQTGPRRPYSSTSSASAMSAGCPVKVRPFCASKQQKRPQFH